MLLYLLTSNSSLDYLPVSCSGRWSVPNQHWNSQLKEWLRPPTGQTEACKYLPSTCTTCQEHRKGGWINKTTEIFAWLGSTKTHPNTIKQLWVMICFVRTALLLQTENKTSWNGCAVMCLSMQHHHVLHTGVILFIKILYIHVEIVRNQILLQKYFVSWTSSTWYCSHWNTGTLIS